MHPNSLKNLSKGVSYKPGQSGNPSGLSIVIRLRHKLQEPCPFDPQGRTWFDAISEAAMRQALTQPRAMETLLDRLEGKVSQPISGDSDNPLLIKLLSQLRGNAPAEDG